jgi:hypothetical protein
MSTETTFTTKTTIIHATAAELLRKTVRSGVTGTTAEIGQ